MSSGWEVSSFCRESNCVEVNIGPTDVLVRDTKRRSDAFLAFSHAEWRAHVDAIGNGEHRLPGMPPPVTFAELHGQIARLDAQRVEQWDRQNRQIYQLKAALRALVSAPKDADPPFDMRPLWRAAEVALGHNA